MKQIIYDNLVEQLSVLCMHSALARAGLTSHSTNHVCIMTSHRELDNLDLVYMTYYYYPDIDYVHWVSPSTSNPLLLQPTKERAIVEYMKNERWYDEGILIEALKSYLMWFRNDNLLYEVADFFRLDRKTLDYWIGEALTDEEV